MRDSTLREDWSSVAEAIKKASVKRKPKVAFYMAGGCSGCDLSLLAMGNLFLDVTENIDIVLWPLIKDYKYSRIKRMYDKTIDLCLFNGAVTNHAQKDMARLLRKKSKVLVALGSCSYLGGIPGMAGYRSRDTVKTKRIINVSDGTLSLPGQDHAHPLSDIIEVDYSIPGCPPPSSLILGFIIKMLENKLPAKGSVFAGDGILCDECERERKSRKVGTFRRSYEKVSDGVCFLDQGLLCMGPVIRAGCGSRCISANMPCRGCFGNADGILDLGGGYISALASVIGGREDSIRKTVEDIPALGGTVYRFSLRSSILKGKRMER